MKKKRLMMTPGNAQKYPWSDNPWVWVYRFERTER